MNNRTVTLAAAMPRPTSTFWLRVVMFLVGLAFYVAAFQTARAQGVLGPDEIAEIMAQERLLAQNAAPAQTPIDPNANSPQLAPLPINIPGAANPSTAPATAGIPPAATGAPAAPAYQPKYPAAAEKAAQMQDILDIRGPVPVPVPIPWMLIGLATLASILLFVAALRGLFGRSHIVVKLPHERALESLGKAHETMAAEEAKAYSYQVSEVVRQYIEARFNARAAHKTTEEFLRELAAKPNSSLTGYTQQLQSFLTNTDYIKFAEARAGVADLQALHESAVRFVIETAPEADTIEQARAEALLRDIERGAHRQAGVMAAGPWWGAFVLAAVMVGYALSVVAWPNTSGGWAGLIWSELTAGVVGVLGAVVLILLAWRPPLGLPKRGAQPLPSVPSPTIVPEQEAIIETSASQVVEEEAATRSATEEPPAESVVPPLKAPAETQAEEDPDAKYRPQG